MSADVAHGESGSSSSPKGSTEQAQDAVERANRLLDYSVEFRNHAVAWVNSPSIHKLVDELLASPYITPKHAAEVSGTALNNAQRIIDKLVEGKLLREVTGRQRNRIYCADRVMQLIDEPLNLE